MECILRWLDEVDCGYFGLRMVWSRYQARFLTVLLVTAIVLSWLFGLSLR